MAAVSNGAKLRSGATRGAKWPIVFSKIQKSGLSFREKTHRDRRFRPPPLIRLKGVTNVSVQCRGAETFGRRPVVAPYTDILKYV